MSGVKTFSVERQHDASGVSGTGVVIEGVQFTDGTVVTRWVSPTPSTVVWASFDDFYEVHIKPHPENLSIVRWAVPYVTYVERGRGR